MYFVNGYKFHRESHGSMRSTSNSGVCIKGTNFSETESDYYGRLIEILQLEYPRLPIKWTILFKCNWFDPTVNVGMKVHKQYFLVDVNQKRKLSKDESFILAMQAAQLYYVPYPSLRKDKSNWLAVCKVKARPVIDVPAAVDKTITTNIAFQEDELVNQMLVAEQPIDAQRSIDESSFLFNDADGEHVDLDEDDNELSEEPLLESEIEETDANEIEYEDVQSSDTDSDYH